MIKAKKTLLDNWEATKPKQNEFFGIWFWNSAHCDTSSLDKNLEAVQIDLENKIKDREKEFSWNKR